MRIPFFCDDIRRLQLTPLLVGVVVDGVDGEDLGVCSVKMAIDVDTVANCLLQSQGSVMTMESMVIS